jgi:hypothetical protein
VNAKVGKPEEIGLDAMRLQQCGNGIKAEFQRSKRLARQVTRQQRKALE